VKDGSDQSQQTAIAAAIKPPSSGNAGAALQFVRTACMKMSGECHAME
jgi:hypothetical protein